MPYIIYILSLKSLKKVKKVKNISAQRCFVLCGINTHPTTHSDNGPSQKASYVFCTDNWYKIAPHLRYNTLPNCCNNISIRVQAIIWLLPWLLFREWSCHLSLLCLCKCYLSAKYLNKLKYYKLTVTHKTFHICLL